MKRCLVFLLITLSLTACVSANPTLVANAVNATLTAAITPTPIVIVVTALSGGATPIPSVTPDLNVQQTLAAATQTLIAGSAMPAPSPTESASPGPTTSSALATASSAPPSATPTSAPPPPAGAIIFTDDFSQPNLWTTGEDSFQRIAVAEGKLSMTLKTEDRFTLAYNIKRRARDFYAVVTASAADCHFRDRYGLLFRLQDDTQYYQFEMDCDGRYRLSKVVNGTLTTLKDWTPSDFIRPGGGAVNKIGVRAVGHSIEVFANDQSLFKTSDETYEEGGFGLYAGSGVSTTYTATFDDLEVREPAP